MKIAIISDIHDNIKNLEKTLKYCRDNLVSELICCGDLTSIETLNFLNDNFFGHIYYTFGNADNPELLSLKFKKKYKKTKIFSDFGKIKLSDKKIAFVHYPDIAKELCQKGAYDFVFYGHTHKPWDENEGNCRLLNPGNISNFGYAPTFAVWDMVENYFTLVEVNNLL